MAVESKVLAIGASCPDFKLKGVDGQWRQRDDFKASAVLVIGFTCNHCPYVQAYEQRLIALVAQNKERGVAFVCINSNDEVGYPEDSFEEMVIRSRKLQFNFHYLRDDAQSVARAFDAACTPEFYVYNRERKLAYHGRLDDSAKDAGAVKRRYLQEAIDAILANTPIADPQTAALGCSIKFKS